MGWFILLAIIALPLLEVAIFIEAVRAVGILPAIAAAVVAGIAGLALWRHQGVQTASRARQVLERGEMPVTEVFDGMCLLLAGGLLLLPGFMSDVVALLLLLPPVRALLRRLLATRMVVTGGPAQQRPRAPTVIEVEYTEISEPGERPQR